MYKEKDERTRDCVCKVLLRHFIKKEKGLCSPRFFNKIESLSQENTLTDEEVQGVAEKAVHETVTERFAKRQTNTSLFSLGRTEK